MEKAYYIGFVDSDYFALGANVVSFERRSKSERSDSHLTHL